MAFTILFPVFPGVTQLDLTAPAQLLARLDDASVVVASRDGAAVETGCGFAIQPNTAFADAPSVDLLCVPGGNVAKAMEDPALIELIARSGKTARYVTSVCTGAFLLGAAGLLKGKRATTHWAYRHLLPMVGAEPVAQRVVKDGQTITGGGVTAGIDFGLAVVAEIGGADKAQRLQLALEYAPAPPFYAGTPETAPQQTRDAVTPFYRSMAEGVEAALKRLTP